MSKRRGREREREGGRPRTQTLARRDFWASIDTRTGEITSRHHDAIASKCERDEITGWAIGVLLKYGFDPVLPLEVRDAIWGD